MSYHNLERFFNSQQWRTHENMRLLKAYRMVTEAETPEQQKEAEEYANSVILTDYERALKIAEANHVSVDRAFEVIKWERENDENTVNGIPVSMAELSDHLIKVSRGIMNEKEK